MKDSDKSDPIIGEDLLPENDFDSLDELDKGIDPKDNEDEIIDLDDENPLIEDYEQTVLLLDGDESEMMVEIDDKKASFDLEGDEMVMFAGNDQDFLNVSDDSAVIDLTETESVLMEPEDSLSPNEPDNEPAEDDEIIFLSDEDTLQFDEVGETLILPDDSDDLLHEPSIPTDSEVMAHDLDDAPQGEEKEDTLGLDVFPDASSEPTMMVSDMDDIPFPGDEKDILILDKHSTELYEPTMMVSDLNDVPLPEDGVLELDQLSDDEQTDLDDVPLPDEEENENILNLDMPTNGDYEPTMMVSDLDDVPLSEDSVLELDQLSDDDQTDLDDVPLPGEEESENILNLDMPTNGDYEPTMMVSDLDDVPLPEEGVLEFDQLSDEQMDLDVPLPGEETLSFDQPENDLTLLVTDLDNIPLPEDDTEEPDPSYNIEAYEKTLLLSDSDDVPIDDDEIIDLAEFTETGMKSTESDDEKSEDIIELTEEIDVEEEIIDRVEAETEMLSDNEKASEGEPEMLEAIAATEDADIIDLIDVEAVSEEYLDIEDAIKVQGASEDRENLGMAESPMTMDEDDISVLDKDDDIIDIPGVQGDETDAPIVEDSELQTHADINTDMLDIPDEMTLPSEDIDDHSMVFPEESGLTDERLESMMGFSDDDALRDAIGLIDVLGGDFDKYQKGTGGKFESEVEQDAQPEDISEEQPEPFVGEKIVTDEPVTTADMPQSKETVTDSMVSEGMRKEVSFDHVPVTQEQVEAALERVIRSMFAEKIERMLMGIIEKAVKKEMNRLKDLLLQDLISDEKP